MTFNRKDLICGFVFVFIGFLFALGGRDLDVGTATRMGPGFFPLVLCGLLILIGLIIIVRSRNKPWGEAFGEVPWRAIGMIVPALILFGYSVRGVGLVPGVLMVAFAAAFSSEKTTLPFALGLAVLLAAFCAGVFHYGLGIPLPLFGPWVKFW